MNQSSNRSSRCCRRLWRRVPKVEDDGGACHAVPGTVSQGLASPQGFTYHTHALPGREECGDANHKSDGRDDPPRAVSRADSKKNDADEAPKDAADTELFGKELTRWIPVADRPSNEIRVGLSTEGGFDASEDLTECRGVCGI